MKFYSIRYSSDINIIGKSPQVQSAEYFCDVWNNPLFIDRFLYKKVNVEPIIANAIVNSKSKITDLINANIIGFHNKLLVSNKLKCLLEINDNENFQYFSSPIKYKNKIIDDFWIVNPSKLSMDNIDFINSEVFVMENIFNYVEKINIKDFNDFSLEMSRLEKSKSLLIEKLQLKENVVENFFIVNHVGGGFTFIVSENLKSLIEQNYCTGIEFQPTEMPYLEWMALGGEREKIYGK